MVMWGRFPAACLEAPAGTTNHLMHIVPLLLALSTECGWILMEVAVDFYG